MVVVRPKELDEMYARREEYIQHRLTLPITDEQYLWWDNILANFYDEAVEEYIMLLGMTSLKRRHRCFDTGLPTRLKTRFQDKTVFAHRFTYVIRVSLPLSTKQVIRHQCANYCCLNAAHIEVGDQAQNFQDLLAVRAYGVRWALLPKEPLDTLQ